jgi:hypothetical protein
MQACPRCERMDAVAKVSGIVSAGTKDRFDSGVQVRPPLATGGGEWSVDLTQTSSTERTDLARRLEFPGELGYGAGVLLALSLTAAFIAIAAFFHLGDMHRMLDDGTYLANYTSYEDFRSEERINNWMVGIGGPLAVLFALASVRAATRYFSGRQEARQVWNTLYYCYRDDVVYVPGSPESCVAPEQAATSVLHYKG